MRLLGHEKNIYICVHLSPGEQVIFPPVVCGIEDSFYQLENDSRLCRSYGARGHLGGRILKIFRSAGALDWRLDSQCPPDLRRRERGCLWNGLAGRQDAALYGGRDAQCNEGDYKRVFHSPD